MLINFLKTKTGVFNLCLIALGMFLTILSFTGNMDPFQKLICLICTLAMILSAVSEYNIYRIKTLRYAAAKELMKKLLFDMQENNVKSLDTALWQFVMKKETDPVKAHMMYSLLLEDFKKIEAEETEKNIFDDE